MNYLECIAKILQSGAEMRLLETGEIEITKASLIPGDVMNAANENYDEIEKWFKSWVDATPVQKTMLKIFMEYCGWTKNVAIGAWLSEVETKMLIVDDWMTMLTKNGWSDVYEDYRQYEDDETDKLAQLIYNIACEFMKNKKAV